MVHVEPEGNETDDVNDRSPHLRESHLQEECTHSGLNGRAVELGKHRKFGVAEFLPLHLGPELDEVNHQEGEYNETEHKHVLRRPLNLRGLRNHVVAVVAASLAVLKGEPDGIDNVDDEEHSEAG